MKINEQTKTKPIDDQLYRCINVIFHVIYSSIPKNGSLNKYTIEAQFKIRMCIVFTMSLVAYFTGFSTLNCPIIKPNICLNLNKPFYDYVKTHGMWYFNSKCKIHVFAVLFVHLNGTNDFALI